ncbi:hypothetical protein GCM10008098_11980 [Rhodanobacter panaciterrae]|uniref:Uncharacterized protein n=1 Tax=Rhodanobacter panaciterrae TaxID=490572 RepID=A0ABQ2ZPM7_9GAMM|nr:hypothetical protein [Rhodanobacter panaciterrae]GGY20912.1 hypothetical protein GCM10008098_11980 [Rhodanobacter panaciterrae]
MRAGSYYALAAVLVLATVPMYRYIFQRSRELERPLPRAVQVSDVSPLRDLPARIVEPSRMPLLPGESCMGGVVVLVSGTTYTNAVDGSGHAVRCEAGFVLR